MQKKPAYRKKNFSESDSAVSLVDVCCDFQALLICMIDKKGVLLSVNQKGCLIIGKKEADLIGSPFIDLLTDDSERVGFHDLLKKKKATFVHTEAHFEAHVKTTSGNILYGWTVACVHEMTCPDSGLVLIGVDLAHKRDIANRIREREERFRALVENTTDWIWEVDHAMRVTYSNDNCKTVTGYSSKELQGKKPFDFMDKKSAARIRQIFDDSKKTGDPIHALAYPIKTKKNKTIVLETNALPLWHKDGSFKGFRGVNRDISDAVRKTAELEKLINENAELSHTVESTPVIVFVWRAEEKWPIEFVTDNIRRFGYSRKDFLSGRILYSSIIHPDDRERVYTEVEQYSRDARCLSFEQEYRIYTKKGQIRWVDDRTTIRRNDQGQITHYHGVILDITKKKEVEIALRAIQNQQRAILDNIPDIAWLKDLESRFISVNKAFMKQCGKELAEIVGKTDFDFWDDAIAQKYRENDLEIIREKKSLRVEEPFIGCDGKPSTIETYKTPIYDDKGQVVGTTGIAHDMTERRKQESRLRLLSAAVEQSSEGLALISLSGILLYVNEAYAHMHGYTPDEMQGSSLTKYHSVQQMKGMIKARETALQDGFFKTELWQLHKSGSSFPSEVTISVLRDDLENLCGFIISTRDTSVQKMTEAALREKKDALEKKNIALNELLAQIELEKKYIKESVSANIEKLIFPLIAKMRSHAHHDVSKQLDILEANLSDLCSSFGQRISQKALLLTPREIEICNMIKSGMSNKEISELLHVSLETIETHRSNIRKKLELTNKNVNLSVYLQSI
jgi:PAS domain S-box-containing protein